MPSPKAVPALEPEKRSLIPVASTESSLPTGEPCRSNASFASLWSPNVSSAVAAAVATVARAAEAARLWPLRSRIPSSCATFARPVSYRDYHRARARAHGEIRRRREGRAEGGMVLRQESAASEGARFMARAAWFTASCLHLVARVLDLPRGRQPQLIVRAVPRLYVLPLAQILGVLSRMIKSG
jgi:hypothetical protein